MHQVPTNLSPSLAVAYKLCAIWPLSLSDLTSYLCLFVHPTPATLTFLLYSSRALVLLYVEEVDGSP